MPVASKPVTYSWMPKGAGKGGQFSNATSHDSDTDYLSFVNECLVDGAQWKIRPGDTFFGQSQFAGVYVDSMYVFNSYSQTNAQIYSFLLFGSFQYAGRYRGFIESYSQYGTRGTMYAIPWINGLGNTTSPEGPYCPVSFASVKNKCYAAMGATPVSGAYLSGPIVWYDQYDNGTQLTYFNWGLPTPTANLQVTVRSTQSGTGNTNGTVTVSALSFNPVTVGLAAGMPFYIDTLKNGQFAEFTIATVTAPSTLTVTSTTANDGVTPIGTQTGTPVQGNFGSMTWDPTKGQGYRYAISYGHTVRGHVGDIGPIFEVKWGPPNCKRVDLTIANICDIEKTPDTRYGPYWLYDAVILWRSANSGGVLQPLAPLTPAGAGASYVQSYPDSQSDDTVLGTVFPGAVGAQAPGTHTLPPIDINFICYWEGRFFAARTSNPGVLYWSASVNEVAYGVPEECWNPLNTVPVPESDGVITGIKTVGASLIVLTQNNLYEVRYGTGTSTSVFRLQRLSAKGQGGGQFASATLPGEDAQSGDILIHYGNDNRIYLLYGAGGDIPISYPIQDYANGFGYSNGVFSTSRWSPGANVNVWHDKRATYIIVQPAVGIFTYLYDIDRKIWLTTQIPTGTFAQGLFNTYVNGVVTPAITPFVADTSGSIYKLGTKTTTNAGVSMSIFTQQMNVPGVARHDEKALQAIFVYGKPVDSGKYIVQYLPDEGQSPVSMVEVSASDDPRVAAYLDAPDAHMFVPQGSTASGRTFKIQVVLAGSNVPVAADHYLSEFMALWTVKSPSTGTI